MPRVNEAWAPGSVIPISSGPRGVCGSASIGLRPEESPSIVTAQRPPWAAPTGKLVSEGIAPIGGVGPTFASDPRPVKTTAPIVSGTAVNVRGSVIAHQPPPRELDPRPTLKGTKQAEPIRTTGFPVPGGLGKTGSVGTTAKTPREKPLPRSPGRSWGPAGETPIPMPIRRGELATLIAPRADGPLPSFAPGASRQAKDDRSVPTRGMFGGGGGRR